MNTALYNKIENVNADNFEITADKTLNLKAVTVAQVTGLNDALNAKLNKEDFKYLSLIEKENIENLLKLLEQDYEFLYTLVGEYLHYATSKLEINEKIVDDFLVVMSDKSLKKKLQI